MKSNNAKLLEAMRSIHEQAKECLLYSDIPCVAQEFIQKVIEISKNALAESKRNCDIGTAEEQSERFRVYCQHHKNPESECLECPIFGITGGHCELAWAQLPYESEVGK